ncbi:DUF4148 domain-containing protein [Cupriavidus metallidurans]|jgi:hypothetical protein|uniref:DUF4148 domain-containing protein n=1 Tax=Cupriavidus metallidurans TaxID=119219 RepID=UPI0007635EB1|nr:DUF4148 domain-containing protein [Cupriavidus metallidurans]KWW35034.1 hypothetical protein AU374_03908 [Cupriavidus metallidurans]
MKTAYLLMLIPALASATAFAQGTQGTQGTSDTGNKRTTAQVRQELIEAKHDGTYARGNAEFPPSEQTVERRKDEHAAARHPNEGKPAKPDAHDMK